MTTLPSRHGQENIHSREYACPILELTLYDNPSYGDGGARVTTPWLATGNPFST